jgi:hypothetical protein
MVMWNVKPWTLYRAKHKVLTPSEGQYEEDYKKMDQWMSEYVNINGNSRISRKVGYDDNAFEAIFISNSQMIWANHKCCLGFHAVDTCFSYHPIYNGKLWVLCLRDSDNKICALSYALTSSEDKDGAIEFGEFCAADKEVKGMLNNGVLYTDGGPALPAFAEFFDSAKQNCCL